MLLRSFNKQWNFNIKWRVSHPGILGNSFSRNSPPCRPMETDEIEIGLETGDTIIKNLSVLNTAKPLTKLYQFTIQPLTSSTPGKLSN